MLFFFPLPLSQSLLHHSTVQTLHLFSLLSHKYEICSFASSPALHVPVANYVLSHISHQSLSWPHNTVPFFSVFFLSPHPPTPTPTQCFFIMTPYRWTFLLYLTYLIPSSPHHLFFYRFLPLSPSLPSLLFDSLPVFSLFLAVSDALSLSLSSLQERRDYGDENVYC